MKKLLTLIAVIALTAPVFADDGDPNVLITIVDEGGGLVQVWYELLEQDDFDPESNPLRGIALRISTSNTAKIDAISHYLTGSAGDESGDIPDGGFPINMGSISFNTQDPNKIADYGDPVAPSDDPGAGDDLPGADEIVTEQGSLYGSGGTPPPTTGMLFKLQLDDNGESDTVLEIEGESTRGGDLGEAVLEKRNEDDKAQANIVLSDEADAYKVEFAPPCWSFPCFAYGDYDGDGFITFLEDVQPLIDAWPPLPYDPCADKNKDGYITFIEDVQPIIDNWVTQCP
jgi:hypothetical protein